MTPTPGNSVCARIGAFGWRRNVCPPHSRGQCRRACIEVSTRMGGFQATAYFTRDATRGVWVFARDHYGDARVWGVWVRDELAVKYRDATTFTVDTARTFVELDNAKEYLRERIDAVWAGITAAAMACTD